MWFVVVWCVGVLLFYFVGCGWYVVVLVCVVLFVVLVGFVFGVDLL